MIAAGLLVAGVVMIMKEPENLDDKFLHDARSFGMQVIGAARPGSIVVFDFDSTLVNPEIIQDYAHTGTRDMWAGSRRALPIYAPVREMIDLCKYANSRNMHIVLITARSDTITMRQCVKANLERHGVRIHELYGFNRNSGDKLSTFKAAIRKRLSLQRPVVLTVGDRWPDVSEPNGAHWIKLSSSDGIFRTSQ